MREREREGESQDGREIERSTYAPYVGSLRGSWFEFVTARFHVSPSCDDSKLEASNRLPSDSHRHSYTLHLSPRNSYMATYALGKSYGWLTVYDPVRWIPRVAHPNQISSCLAISFDFCIVLAPLNRIVRGVLVENGRLVYLWFMPRNCVFFFLFVVHQICSFTVSFEKLSIPLKHFVGRPRIQVISSSYIFDRSMDR